jgi:two-component system chemotaxis response regulator CheB
MAKRDIIVIGASAGGVAVLEQLVSSFPEDFPAFIFIVMHTPPHSPSKLPQILSRAGALAAVHPAETEKIEQGKIYVAPPDHHLLIEEENVTVRKKPCGRLCADWKKPPCCSSILVNILWMPGTIKLQTTL